MTASADLTEPPAGALRLRGIAVDRAQLVAPGEIPRTTSGKVRCREVARTLARGRSVP